MSIVHAGRLTALAGFFPVTGSVQERTDTLDAHGQPVPTWANHASITNVSARIMPKGGRELKRSDGTVAISTHVIGLRGHYADARPDMRFVSGSDVYDILLVESDGQSSYTHLVCEVVV